jgi:uncharacterized protein YigA (DUF484 family)
MSEITEHDVAEYLQKNVDFFQRHAHLLADLQVPHIAGAAVSLVERQVSVLRERNVELRERLHSMVEVARSNDYIFEKMRGLILSLLEARDLLQLLTSAQKEIKKQFKTDFVSVTLFDAEPLANIHCVSMQAAKDVMPSLLRGNHVIAGQLRQEELNFLFGNEGMQVKSCVIVPLFVDKTWGVLSLGSANAEHFRAGMDSLFVAYLGDVLARLVQGFLYEKSQQVSA